MLVDEAYVDFGGESALPLIDRHPNLLVVQTLSKSRSLAGLRVGFACGQAHLIEALQRVKNSFNSYPLDRLASAGAIAALEDEAWFAKTRDAVVDTREGLALQLEDLGFEVLPSQANFLFVRHPAHDAAALAAALRARAVLVRHFGQPRIAQYLRISVGTRDQCSALVDALGFVGIELGRTLRALQPGSRGLLERRRHHAARAAVRAPGSRRAGAVGCARVSVRNRAASRFDRRAVDQPASGCRTQTTW